MTLALVLRGRLRFFAIFSRSIVDLTRKIYTVASSNQASFCPI